jgi:hypothetical protein
MTTRIIAVLLLVASCSLGSKPSHALPAEKPLPSVFVSVLAEVKARTNISLLLPSELPKPLSNAKHATVDEVKADQYGVLLYYELGVGDAGFAASFLAKKNAPYSPRELANVQKVKLAGGIVGFFRPVSCGGSCAPANLWWEQGGVLYQIQLELPSTIRDKNQQSIITKIANSAIVAGPR